VTADKFATRKTNYFFTMLDLLAAPGCDGRIAFGINPDFETFPDYLPSD